MVRKLGIKEIGIEISIALEIAIHLIVDDEKVIKVQSNDVWQPKHRSKAPSV